jgi:hypothetical protein
VIVLAASGTAFAGRGGAVAIPPAEVDFGAGTSVGDTVVGPSTDILVGVHWASLYWKPTKVDVGIGYVGSFRDTFPEGSPAVARTMPLDEPDHRLRLNGGYLDVAYALETHPHWRTWLSTRIEMLHAEVNGREFAAVGSAARLATEFYASGVAMASDHSSGAIVAGTFALGIYVEASHRNLPSDLGPTEVSAGFSIRIPFLAAVAN